jgi:excisionase family DNA binding protein
LILIAPHAEETSLVSAADPRRFVEQSCVVVRTDALSCPFGREEPASDAKDTSSGADGFLVDNEAFVDGGEWLSARLACELLSIATADLYRLIDAGRVPAFKFGNEIRLRRRDVEALTAAQ